MPENKIYLELKTVVEHTIDVLRAASEAPDIIFH